MSAGQQHLVAWLQTLFNNTEHLRGDRARRSSASLFGGDLGSPPLSPVALAQRTGSSSSFPSPSDVVALSVTKAKASPGTQVRRRNCPASIPTVQSVKVV